MKISTVVFTNSLWGLPLLYELFRMKVLAGIVLPAREHSENDQIAQFAKENEIPFIKVNRKQLKSELTDWLIDINPDLAFCMTFPYLIPEEILEIPRRGVVNFHFGKLPEYAGPDPIFWYLKEGKQTITITAYKMGATIDAGQLLLEKEVSIIPGENWGILGARLSLLSVSMISQVTNKITQSAAGNLKEVKENTQQKRINSKELQIDWTNQTADQIESLINACNPTYGGAITYLRGAQVRILEVSPADLRNVSSFSPGTIVVSDMQSGIFVLCSDFQFLRVNLLRTNEAYMTGYKLAAMGVKTNERFYADEPVKEHQKIHSNTIL